MFSVAYLLTAITKVFVIHFQKSKILWISESLERYLSNVNPRFHWDHNLSFFGLLGPFISWIWTLMTPFERFLSKLSENQKIIEIGSTEFKLWQLKESPNHWLNQCVLLTAFGIVLSSVRAVVGFGLWASEADSDWSYQCSAWAGGEPSTTLPLLLWGGQAGQVLGPGSQQGKEDTRYCC